MKRNVAPALIAFFGVVFFIGVTLFKPVRVSSFVVQGGAGRVVVSAPVLVFLHGGDRFLAANIEAMRLAATGVSDSGVNSEYLIRAQGQVSRLNPCHEDNYYLANGLLAWGGAVAEGNKVLEAAMYCRSWDFVPAFFLGVNLAFFNKDNVQASGVLELGAERSAVNAAALRKLAIVLRAEELASEQLARDYLVSQRDSTRDVKLKAMLDKRVVRLDGLLLLRVAQREYEKKYGLLVGLDELLERGILQSIPDDPLRLGYEVKNGQVVFKKLKIIGLEEQL